MCFGASARGANIERTASKPRAWLYAVRITCCCPQRTEEHQWIWRVNLQSVFLFLVFLLSVLFHNLESCNVCSLNILID